MIAFRRLAAIAMALPYAALPWNAAAQTTVRPLSLQQLQNGFQSPPPEARLRCYWWWLNGNTTEETITNDLTEMSRKGYGGVLLVDANGSNQNGNSNVPSGPRFGSPEWLRLYVHALQLAAQLRLEVTLNITSGWNLGGPDVKPEEASKLLTWSRTTVESGGFDGTLSDPPATNGFYRQIAVLAYPLAHGPHMPGDVGAKRSAIRDLKQKSAAVEMGFSMPHTEGLLEDAPSLPGEQDTKLADVLDISSRVDARGHLAWRPPGPGTWEILRIGYTDSGARVSTSSGSWQGLAIDYLDRGAFDTYWDRTVVPLLEVSRLYLKNTLVNLATDSWELGGTNWTGRFADEFRKLRGYDLVHYLPVVAGRIVEDRATSNRFLADLRRTVGDLVTDHYDHFAERARAYGLGIQAESGGPHGAPLDALQTFRSAAVPQTEYWAESAEHRSTDQDRYFTKEAASAANIYGKRFVANEGMTSIGPQWSESPATDLKPSFDHALTEGMNRLVWHEFTSSPKSSGLPGNEYFAGTHMNPNVTWWNDAGAFLLYLNRAQFMLQQGHAVDDILYFYGDEVPNFVRLKRDDPAHVLPGFDYDVTNEDALLHTLAQRAGSLSTPAGNKYRLLVLPKSRKLSLASLERIADYVYRGGVVAGLPPLGPTGVVGGEAQSRFDSIVGQVWEACAASPHPYGAGTVFCTADAREALRALNLPPDFEAPGADLDYVHRTDGVNDVYFVRNGSAKAQDLEAFFRVGSRTPQLWSAIDGSITAPAYYRTENTRMVMPLHLDPYGSIFVVLTRGRGGPAPRPRAAGLAQRRASRELPASQWTISFQADRGAPTTPAALSAFESWTSSADPRIRYFSGTATYRTGVELHPRAGEHTFLALSELHEICSVRVNGQDAGTIWAMPYRLDITARLYPGRNDIELRVTNLWPNRIIGDAQPGVAQTYTRTNIRKYTANSPLLPSGLIGPVTLETVQAPR